MKAVWPNVVVEENNLNPAISALRKALGESAVEHRFIVTVPGRGYRFVAPVRIPGTAEPQPTTPAPAPVAATTTPTVRRRASRPIQRYALIALLVFVAALAAWSIWRATEETNTQRATGDSTSVATGTLRLAILPFDNLSPDPANGFFADGLHEEILSTLARRASGLEVVSRTTMMGYRLKPKPVLQVAKDLAASHVIEGSVRREQDKVRLTLQLIDARNDRHLWSKNYDRTLSDALTLQSDVAAEVASQLSVQLTGATQAASPPTENPEAYDLFLKALVARQFVTPFAPVERYREVEDLLTRAIALDPSFTSAYAQRATFRGAIYAFNYDVSDEHVRRVREDIDAGLRLAPDDPFVLASEALYWGWVGRDLPRALTAYEASEAAGLADSMFLTGKAGILMRMRRVAEATGLVERLMALDPANPFIIGGLGSGLAYARRPADAIRILDRGLEMFPDNPALSSARAQVIFAYTGRSDEWRDLLERGALEATREALLDQQFTLLRIERRYVELQRLLDEVSETRMRVIAGTAASGLFGAGDRPTAEYRGWTALLLDDAQAAGKHGRTVLEFVATAKETTRNAWFLRLLTAESYTFLRQDARAVATAREALELMPPSRDAITSLPVATLVAAIYAWSDAQDEAVALLEELSTAIPGPGPASIARDPLFAIPLAENPRFRALVERLEQQMRATHL
jgi:TolB-like protein